MHLLGAIRHPVFLGKASFWDAWMSFLKIHELTNTFTELSVTPEEITGDNLRILGEFVMYVYFGVADSQI